MAFLYLDTTNELILGILDKKFEWLAYTEIKERKSSELIHSMIEKMLGNCSLEIEELTHLFLASGPGSYTGMRLAEGIAQVLEWRQVKVFGFYHFEVPQILGIDSGRFLAGAYKKEIFQYSWEAQENSWSLIKEQKLGSSNCYFNADSELWGKELSLKTSQMIKNNAPIFFKYIAERGVRGKPFYYRELEQEFTVSQPLK